MSTFLGMDCPEGSPSSSTSLTQTAIWWRRLPAETLPLPAETCRNRQAGRWPGGGDGEFDQPVTQRPDDSGASEPPLRPRAREWPGDQLKHIHHLCEPNRRIRLCNFTMDVPHTRGECRFEPDGQGGRHSCS